MKPAVRGWVALLACVGVTAACSAIFGLDPPPIPAAPDAPGAGDGGKPDGDASPAAEGGDAEDAGSDATTCAPLDATADGVTYYPLRPAAADGGATPWEFFAITRIVGTDHEFVGATFDGQYLYLASRSNDIVRFDTTGVFAPPDVDGSSPTAWESYRLPSKTFGSGDFLGAVYDGRFVYFVPGIDGTVPLSKVARFDTHGVFSAPASWTSFDTTSIDGGTALSGFAGGTFDGRYVYFAPNQDGDAHFDGWVVRYDTTAGDGGNDFADAAAWSSYDLSALDAGAAGFFGAVYDGTYVYLAPQHNGAWNNRVNGGASSIVTRYDTQARVFAKADTWSTFDTTSVSGNATDFTGAGFDGRYVYFAPRSLGTVVRYDTSVDMGSVSSWESYDLLRLFPDAGAVRFSTVMFDGRFVYFSPSAEGFATIVRYDTMSPFRADCAWSTYDLASIDAGRPFVDGGPAAAGYYSTAFDGEYLYLIPDYNGLVARFLARSKAPLPLSRTHFHGSFF